MNEIWKEIPGFPQYKVSNLGRIWSNHYARVRALQIRPSGYPAVKLCPDLRYHRVHALVLLAFVGPRPPGKFARHLDGNKLNAHLENLKYGTRAENDLDRYRLGEWAIAERNANTKLSREIVRHILREFKSPHRGLQRKLARKYGVSDCAIRLIRLKKNWKHVN